MQIAWNESFNTFYTFRQTLLVGRFIIPTQEETQTSTGVFIFSSSPLFTTEFDVRQTNAAQEKTHTTTRISSFEL